MEEWLFVQAFALGAATKTDRFNSAVRVLR